MSKPCLLPALSFALILPLSQGASAGTSTDKWQYAGESQGVEFSLKISNECKDGSKVSIRMESKMDRPAIVTFRLNDSDWRKTFTKELKAEGKATVQYSPEGTACHPFIDQVYLDSKEDQVTRSSDEE